MSIVVVYESIGDNSTFDVDRVIDRYELGPNQRLVVGRVFDFGKNIGLREVLNRSGNVRVLVSAPLTQKG